MGQIQKILAKMQDGEVSVGIVAYKRPLFLAECIKALHRKPGKDFKLLIWSNDVNNEGSYALKYIFDKVTTKYFVVVEEDELWFQDDWLKLLIEAFEQTPDVTPKGLEMGFKNEWGILASNMLSDDVNPVQGITMYDRPVRFTKGKFTYWTNIHAGGGVMIFKTEVLRKLNPFQKTPTLNGGLYPLLHSYDVNRWPQGIVENIYCYHAFTPYWNSLYPEVFKTKQKGETIEDHRHRFVGVDYNNGKPMQMFLRGQFNKYAKNIYNRK